MYSSSGFLVSRAACINIKLLYCLITFLFFGQIVPSRKQIKCRSQVLEMVARDYSSRSSSSSGNSTESATKDVIWYGTMTVVLVSLIVFLLSDLLSFKFIVDD